MPPIVSISVVVPVYNSENSLLELTRRLEPVLMALTECFEVILVNDGSRDRGWEAICALCIQYPWVRGINLMRNYGQHNALLCGVRAAQNEFLVTMDDDLQHCPEEIPKLLFKLAEGYDVVYGIADVMPHTWWRNWFSVATKRSLAYLMGAKTIRDLSAFRMFRSHLRHAFTNYNNCNVILDALLSWGTTKFATVVVHEEQRSIGRSNYSLTRLMQVAGNVMTGFSTLPLRFASVMGLLLSFFGVLVLLYAFGVFFFAGSVPGFTFLASIIAIFGGAQLFTTGILGEYLARVFDRSIDRPPYVIMEETVSKDV